MERALKESDARLERAIDAGRRMAIAQAIEEARAARGHPRAHT
jgi:hypothetical protein